VTPGCNWRPGLYRLSQYTFLSPAKVTIALLGTVIAYSVIENDLGPCNEPGRRLRVSDFSLDQQHAVALVIVGLKRII